MKIKSVGILFLIAVLMSFIAGCTATPESLPTKEVVATDPVTQQPSATSTSVTVEPQALLELAMDHFMAASSFQMKTHEITAYQANIADGTVRTIYGEFMTTYDIHREPEFKVRVQSQYRYSPETDFFSEEYFLFERNGAAYFSTFGEDGKPSIEELGGQSIEKLIGDTYQAISQFGMNAQFSHHDNGDYVYILEPSSWYLLTGAVQFADLGLLLAGPDGEAMVKEYAEQMYPNVQPSRFTLHVSLDDQMITAVEMENKDFMLSFWGAYDQALIEQGADPDQLTEYEILPEHGAETLFDSYDQAPDFEIPE